MTDEEASRGWGRFPTVVWPEWDSEVTFLPGDLPPLESEGRLWAVLAFVFYGDKIALADIAGRGMCIPSGKIEPGETIDAAVEREAFEETGAQTSPEKRRLIGCYRMIARGGSRAGEARYCPVFVAEAMGFEEIPPGSESRGVFFAAIEDMADVYFFWDALIAEVFAYAAERREELVPRGVPLSGLIEGE